MRQTARGSPSTASVAAGNDASKALIKSWAPQTTAVDTGVVLMSNPDNMKRFVRARILLEEPNTGCIASFDDSLSVVRAAPRSRQHALPCAAAAPHPKHMGPAITRIPEPDRRPRIGRAQVVCRFGRAEHQLLLPLWPSGELDERERTKTLHNLVEWHRERFPDGARLSGKCLEAPEDQTAWTRAAEDFRP